MLNIMYCIASLFGATGVLFGAFGAHYLKKILSEDLLTAFETGVRYQLFHTFALFLAAFASAQYETSYFQTAYWLFFVGTLFFSGSIYLLSTLQMRSLGIVTPIGGTLLLMAWLFLSYGFWKGMP